MQTAIAQQFMHNIENEFLKVSARNLGAELTSLFSKKSNIEHLWQADQKWWGWHAPVLFPVVGRCQNDRIHLGKKAYPMEKHGFARKSNFDLIEQSETAMVFSLKSSDSSKQFYPFEFEFNIGFELHKNSLQQWFSVSNKHETPMLFSLGAHPAFAVPFSKNEAFNQYHLEFEHAEILNRKHIDTDGFFNGVASIVSTNGNIHLTPELFNSDALIFKDHTSRSVCIKSNLHSHWLKVTFDGFPYLGIWTKEGAPYVCIEPWFGCADTANQTTDFAAKEGIVALQPGKKFYAALQIEVG